MRQNQEMNFKMMSFIHETLYGLFRDPVKALYAAGLGSGQNVLEVGCGPGFFTIPAAKIVGETGNILALDVNPFAVEHVRQKIETAGITNAQTLLANAAQTNLPDHSFDLTFLFGLGRPIGDMDKMWSELHRLLKPGGTLSIEGRLRPPNELFQPVTRQGRISRFRRVD